MGTRPEAIKMAPVVEALRARPDAFATSVCTTAQHRELTDRVLERFGILPDHDLDLMQPGQGLNGLAARALVGLGEVIERDRPDVVLVQGDTTTVLAGALAAHHARVAVGHVEAGLRTGDKWQPFPEEMNRLLTDRLADWCFAPTERARANLLAEGLDPATIHVTGNTGIDTLLRVRDRLDDPAFAPWIEAFRDRHELAGRRLVLVTGHRRENHGEPLERVCRAIRAVARRGDVTVVYPAHPHPEVQRAVTEVLAGSAVKVTDPVDYPVLVWLLASCELVLTDSGGIQEEAAALGKPTLVLRETTERPEVLEAGVARLVGTDEERIVAEAERLLDDPAARAAVRPTAAFGDGRAAERIAAVLAGEPPPPLGSVPAAAG